MEIRKRQSPETTVKTDIPGLRAGSPYDNPPPDLFVSNRNLPSYILSAPPPLSTSRSLTGGAATAAVASSTVVPTIVVVPETHPTVGDASTKVKTNTIRFSKKNDDVVEIGGGNVVARHRHIDINSLRYKMHMLLNHPASSNWAFAISMCIMFLIFFSSITFVVETLFPPDYMDNLWYCFESICVACFTLEFVLRWLVNIPNLHLDSSSSSSSTASSNDDDESPPRFPKLREYWQKFSSFGPIAFLASPMNWIDLVSIVPFYVELLSDAASISSTRVFRIIRLARVIRVFKVSKYSSRMQIVGLALVRSREVLLMLFFVLSIVTVVFSSLIYFAERGSWTTSDRGYASDINDYVSFPVWMRKEGPVCGLWNNSTTRWEYLDTGSPCQMAHQGNLTRSSGCCPAFMFCLRDPNNSDGRGECWGRSPFQSIVHAFYYTIVTVTTVGYGDLVPKAPLGRVVAVFCVLTGIIMIALPISIIGVNFSNLWSELGLFKQQQKIAKQNEDGDLDMQAQKVGRSCKTFRELVESIHGCQDDIDTMLREMRKRSSDWGEMIEENKKKSKNLQSLCSVLQDVVQSGNSLNELVQNRVRIMTGNPNATNLAGTPTTSSTTTAAAPAFASIEPPSPSLFSRQSSLVIPAVNFSSAVLNEDKINKYGAARWRALSVARQIVNDTLLGNRSSSSAASGVPSPSSAGLRFRTSSASFRSDTDDDDFLRGITTEDAYASFLDRVRSTKADFSVLSDKPSLFSPIRGWNAINSSALDNSNNTTNFLNTTSSAGFPISDLRVNFTLPEEENEEDNAAGVGDIGSSANATAPPGRRLITSVNSFVNIDVPTPSLPFAHESATERTSSFPLPAASMWRHDSWIAESNADSNMAGILSHEDVEMFDENNAEFQNLNNNINIYNSNNNINNYNYAADVSMYNGVAASVPASPIIFPSSFQELTPIAPPILYRVDEHIAPSMFVDPEPVSSTIINNSFVSPIVSAADVDSNDGTTYNTTTTIQQQQQQNSTKTSMVKLQSTQPLAMVNIPSFSSNNSNNNNNNGSPSSSFGMA